MSLVSDLQTKELMKHLMKNEIVTIVLIGIALNGCQSNSQTDKYLTLDKSPLKAIVPKEIVQNTLIYTVHPSLNFSLPKGKDGGAPGFPSFNISKFSSELNIKDIKSLENKLLSIPKAKLIEEPRYLKVSGNIAIEYSLLAKVTSDFVVGGSEESSFISNQVVIEHTSGLYTCSMDVSIDEYEQYKSLSNKLCYSITFD
ncbi:hypothetical protein FE810_14820 [Thalassotalea litorea]|uniref:Uncharacterized protein n=1 Tax=Thalassotalea litorea TaxID=2020715 RepID=A0A5R9ICI3_9GAMM|nr:hypothetical protein [Thalassotalea litorea]TLU61281.1 hypothetical protein FE810_14820 [Thalassotalea litorea]